MLNKLYAPVQDDLVKVEEYLVAISQAELPWLPQQLAANLRSCGRLKELLAHSLAGGGKRMRPALTLLAGKLYHYNPDVLLPMAVAIEVMHTATLVHDDAIDKSPVRRGRATVSKLWGDETAVLLGDYLFAEATKQVKETRSLPALELLTQALMTLCSGELAQNFAAFSFTQSRQNYLDRIISKTASLFTLAAQSGAMLSRAPQGAVTILKEYGHNLGIAFQIVDDILDYVGTEAELGKPVASDLAQGTLTLPAMLLLERYPQNNPVQIIFEGGEKKENIKRAIEMVRNSNIVRECYDLAADFAARACRDLARLPDCPSRQSLRDLAGFTVARRN